MDTPDMRHLCWWKSVSWKQKPNITSLLYPASGTTISMATDWYGNNYIYNYFFLHNLHLSKPTLVFMSLDLQDFCMGKESKYRCLNTDV